VDLSPRPRFPACGLESGQSGDDADTTGVVCEQLAGTYWGVEGIPPDWLDAKSSKGRSGVYTPLVADGQR